MISDCAGNSFLAVMGGTLWGSGGRNPQSLASLFPCSWLLFSGRAGDYITQKPRAGPARHSRRPVGPSVVPGTEHGQLDEPRGGRTPLALVRGLWKRGGLREAPGGQQAGSRLRFPGFGALGIQCGGGMGSRWLHARHALFGSQLMALWGDSWQTGGTIGDARFKPGLATHEAKALSIPWASAPTQMCTFGILSDLGCCLLTESKHAGLVQWSPAVDRP